MAEKQITPDGRLWYIPGDSLTKVGFTKQLLDEIQSECWSVIPTHSPIKKGQPLFAIETNDTLLSIISPFEGRIHAVNFDAQNSPEKLKDSTVVFEVRPHVPGKTVPGQVPQPPGINPIGGRFAVPRDPGRRPRRPNPEDVIAGRVPAAQFIQDWGQAIPAVRDDVGAAELDDDDGQPAGPEVEF